MIKEGIAASDVIKAMRGKGYSFSGKRVRALYNEQTGRKTRSSGERQGQGDQADMPTSTKKAAKPEHSEAATATA